MICHDLALHEIWRAVLRDDAVRPSDVIMVAMARARDAGIERCAAIMERVEDTELASVAVAHLRGLKSTYQQ